MRAVDFLNDTEEKPSASSFLSEPKKSASAFLSERPIDVMAQETESKYPGSISGESGGTPYTADEQAVFNPGRNPKKGLLGNMGEALLDPVELAATAGTGAITGAMKAGAKGAVQGAIDYGTMGLSNVGRGVKNFGKELLRNPAAIEARTPVTQALPLDEVVKRATSGIPETQLPLRTIAKNITTKKQTPLLTEAGFTPVDSPTHAMPFGGRAEINPSEIQKLVTKEGKKSFSEMGKISTDPLEKRLLQQTGTIKPLEMSRVPRKPGMDAIMHSEEITGMNKRIRRGPAGELGAAFETPIRMFEKLGGNAKKQIYDPIDSADLAAVNEYENILKQMVKRWKSSGANQKKIGKYMVGKQEEGKKILNNMGLKVEPLNPQEKEVVKEMGEFYEEMFDRINDARVRSGKKPMGEVENYYTFFRKLDWLSDKLGYNPFQAQNVSQDIAKHFHPNSTIFKFAKKRTKNYIPVDVNAFDAIKKYGLSAYNHIHISPEIAKARELLKPIAKSFPEAEGDVTKWLDFVSGIRPFKTPWDKQISTLTKNNAMGILSGNVRSALIQPTAIVNTLTAAGPIHTFNGIMDLAKQAGSKSAREFVRKNSNLPARKFDVLIDSMASPLGKVATKAADWGTKPLQVLDMLTANASWNSFYRKGSKAMGMTDKEAFRYANDMVIKSQASGRAHHISPAQRSSLGKAATTLQTFVINDWAFLTQDVLGLGKNVPMNKENLKKAFYYIAATTGVNALYEEGLNMNSPYGRPLKALTEGLSEDDPNYLDVAKSVGTEIGERVPVVGGAIRYGSGIGGATLDTLKKSMIGEGYRPSAIGDVAEGAYSKALGEDADISPYSVETLGKLAGVPGSSQARKMWTRRKGGEDWLNTVVGTKPPKE